MSEQQTLDGIRLRVQVCKDEAEWLKGRADGVGASESWQITHDNGYKLHLEKTGQWVNDFKGNDLTEFGHRSEGMNAQWFSDATGLETHDEGDYAMFWHESLPMFATVDRFVRGDNGGHVAVCELKAAFGGIAYLVEKITSTELQHTKLERYYWQVQHQLACTDLNEGYLSIIYFTGYSCGHRWFKCKRNEKVIRAIEKRVREFWDCVESRTPPSWKYATAADVEAIRAMHAPTEGRAVELEGKSDFEWFAQLEAADAKRKAAAKEFEKLKAQGIARMAEEGAEKIVAGNKEIRYSNKRWGGIKEVKGE